MQDWNNMEELPPPTKASTNSSPARSTGTNSTVDEDEDFSLTCTGLLGEEILMDTEFGQLARASLQATAESLRKLSELVVKPIHKKEETTSSNVVLVDHDALLKENERLKRENTWLQEENQSLRGGTYDEEDVLSHKTGNSV